MERQTTEDLTEPVCIDLQGRSFSFSAVFIERTLIRIIDSSEVAQHDRITSLVEQILSHNKQLQEVRTPHERTGLQRTNRAIYRQRIAALVRKEPQPMQKDRGAILHALLAANGGKMLAKEARKRMRMSKQSFTNLLAVTEGIVQGKGVLSKRFFVRSSHRSQLQ